LWHRVPAGCSESSWSYLELSYQTPASLKVRPALHLPAIVSHRPTLHSLQLRRLAVHPPASFSIRPPKPRESEIVDAGTRLTQQVPGPEFVLSLLILSAADTAVAAVAALKESGLPGLPSLHHALWPYLFLAPRLFLPRPPPSYRSLQLPDSSFIFLFPRQRLLAAWTKHQQQSFRLACSQLHSYLCTPYQIPTYVSSAIPSSESGIDTAIRPIPSSPAPPQSFQAVLLPILPPAQPSSLGDPKLQRSCPAVLCPCPKSQGRLKG
jgi:hypothetical protein